MKRQKFSSVIALILLASPVWWTTGCYSNYQITSPAEAADKPIEITTKGKNHYVFTEWSADSSGNIQGRAPFVVPVAIRSDGAIKQQLPSQYVPKDSIAAIYTQSVSVGSTILAVILTAAGVVAAFIGAFCLGLSI
jgi:hypothetical protein